MDSPKEVTIREIDGQYLIIWNWGGSIEVNVCAFGRGAEDHFTGEMLGKGPEQFQQAFYLPRKDEARLEPWLHRYTQRMNQLDSDKSGYIYNVNVIRGLINDEIEWKKWMTVGTFVDPVARTETRCFAEPPKEVRKPRKRLINK